MSVQRALDMIATITSEAELRAYRDALPELQPEVAADRRVQDAILERWNAILRKQKDAAA